MKEYGRVVDVGDGVVSVHFRRSSMCSRCGACGMGSGQNDITVDVPNALNARIGDEVEVQFATRSALASSAAGYMFPLLLLLIGVFVGYSLPPIGALSADVTAAICGILFSVGAFFVLKLLNPFMERRFGNIYTMTARYPVHPMAVTKSNTADSEF